MVNLGNINGEFYFSHPDVVDRIISFIPCSRSFSRLYCPTAGDGAIAKQITAKNKHCNDIMTKHRVSLGYIADTVTHDDATCAYHGKFDLIVDNLPLYVYENGRNICGEILLQCYKQLTDDGVMVVTLPHNFFKKKYNKDVLTQLPTLKCTLITSDDIPDLWSPFLIATIGI